MKFLLVGCGSIGLRHLKNLNQHCNGEFFICDPDSSRIDQAAKNVKISGSFVSIEEVGNNMFDGILICSPSSMHVGMAKQLMKNTNSLFIEKPISDSLNGLDELIDECKVRGIRTMIGMSYRFNFSILKIKELIKSGALGKVYSSNICFGQFLPTWHPDRDYTVEYTARSSLGGGALLTTGSHVLDMIRFLFGDIIDYKFYMDRVSDLKIDVDDFCSGLIKSNSGVNILCQFDFLHVPKTSSISIVGSKKKICCDLITGELRIFDGITNDVFIFENSLTTMYENEIKHFLQIVGGEASLCDFEDGKKNMEHLASIKKTCGW